MQTAEVSNRLDLAIALDRSREGSTLTERQMGAGAVVIVGIRLKHAAQMRFTKDDHGVQARSVH